MASCLHGDIQSVHSSKVISYYLHAHQPSQYLCHVQAFYLPATKHPWWWLGIRPIDKKNFGDLLKAKNSVVLVPGGVSECMVMEQGGSNLTKIQLVFLVPLLAFCHAKHH